MLLTFTKIKSPVLKWISVYGVTTLRIARKLLLAIILLDIPFQLDMHLGIRQGVTDSGGLGGWCISVTTIALLGLYIIWIVETITKNNKAETHFLSSKRLAA